MFNRFSISTGLVLGVAVLFSAILLNGCGSKGDGGANTAAPSDPQKAAVAGQRGVANDAANQQARAADEARRATQPK
ncbi:hypothetical protein B1R32_10529 [Abditibacterium utsteinense]|uniref:Uncharacterized protein n=1 Tax=Abditibacterium utsteinense TaxID=1960156 RepID=A0A2S8SU97_9BACT|nr:hypothetical protein [Abditibacterium utsteinense]PQV64348.1 hypothetical protein B1R32_10529 [Abditibacterium utsteinense]